ncbi:MAG: GAF domain-containing protein, partial [Chitinophagaceae bacterium]
MHALIGMNDVEVGFTPFMKINNRFVLDETCITHSLIGRNWKQDNEESIEAFNTCLQLLKEHPEATAFTVLDDEITNMVRIFKRLWREGVRSYIVYPIRDEQGILGLLELASPVPNQLDLEVLKRLEPAMPLLSLALLKTRNAFNDRIEKMIKENFTALQPAVEWKFAEAAWESMNKDKGAGKVIRGNVVFDNVYPLYGAIDIRNSSIERGFAIQKDLNGHLDLIDRTLDKLMKHVKLPLLDGLKFKVSNFRTSMKNGLAAEDEVRFNEFFDRDLNAMFSHLQHTNEQVSEIVNEYFSEVNLEGSTLYVNRNEYEETMQTINNAVLKSIMAEEQSIQESFPHYFEKYRTDGVEYTIYIGQSISPEVKFDMMYLQNLRLWQIKSMAEVARITHNLLPELRVPLQTTQLILVHSQPISIGFRKDERRFDVEGAYNIRYEIMKKRLDKVHIEGTNERLTQPGKIAIVYSNPREAQEYNEYIYYLQSKGLLKPGIENLELEELQGVRGLKALRV